MARTTITIPTATAIQMLQERLDENVKAQAEDKVIQEEYREARKKWEEELLKNLSNYKIESSSAGVRYDGTLNVTLYFAKEGFPAEPIRRDNPYRQINSWEVQELQGLIKLLQAHTEPVVGAGTLNKMSKFL